MAPLFFLVLFSLITTLHSIDVVSPTLIASLNRSSFPPGFIFGTGSAAYQFEGAAFQGKKGQSIWDNHTHGHSEKIVDGSNGDVAEDEYHRYKEDVGILKDMNVDAYRFSISWPRILPTGKVSGGVNQEGVDYYNNLINELLDKGMKPFVTLFHWDLPQALQDEYGGFLSPRIVWGSTIYRGHLNLTDVIEVRHDFQEYADLCFQKFGDRVKYWTTFNEPYTYTKAGYIRGYFPPRRCSKFIDPTCEAGDSGVEPYNVTHEQLRAHAAAVHVYRNKYQKSQKGVIGITLVSNWYVPASNSSEDKAAALRAVDFMYGWFMGPITYGDYPPSMRALVGNRLPQFTKKDAKLLTGSFDFIGLNYYTSNYAAHASKAALPSYLTDAQANFTTEINGVPIGPRSASEWLYVYPKGIQDLLVHTKEVYNNPPIYITENGCSEFNDPTMPLEESLIDTFRIDYYYRHLYHVKLAIENRHVNIKGYFAWSFLDNFEWSAGYTIRFGLVFIDFKDNLKRYPKMSAKWFADFLKKN